MDQFEKIRTTAAALHADIVAKGANALCPMDLVTAAVQHLELELVWLPEGDPALKGARGLFDEQSGTICCADDGDLEIRVCLAAHELGHTCLHPLSTECRADDIDAARSTEAAPVGLQRIEDYGAHERRELQANVFAREFVLPRAVARKLYLEDRVGATDIASKLQLPKDLVRQQLLDALLLPEYSEPETGNDSVPTLTQSDASQERAAVHRGSAFQLQAGPGTGKTRTLVKRVQSLLNDGIDPSTILVLTFSNRAAGELAERLSNIAPEATAKMWIGTFHAFGLDLIRRYHDRLDLPARPTLFDRSDAIEVLEEILPTLPLTHYRNLWDPAMVLRDIVMAISRAKDEMTDPARYRHLARTMLDAASDDDALEAAEKVLEVAHVYELYEQALNERRAVDFGDIIMRPALLLEADEAIRRTVQLRHRHVLVDEYQDVNRASGRFLRSMSGDGSRLWVVGDARQSIYRFRGASSANMETFGTDYPGAVVDKLDINYRSSEEVVRCLVAIAPHMGASRNMLPLALKAHPGTLDTRPELRRFSTLEDEIEGVAANVRDLSGAGIRFRDQAVLCRSNKRLNEIASGLEARGVPVLHLGSLFEREEIRDLLALLSFAVDRLGEGVVRLAALERYAIPLQDTHSVAQFLRESTGSISSRLEMAADQPKISTQGVQGLRKLSADLAGLRENGSAWEYLTTYLLDRTNLIEQIVSSDAVVSQLRGIAIWQFLNFVRDQSPIKSGRPIQRTLDRVRQMVLLAEERDLRQIPVNALHIDAVRLMTVHGSKGLEFEAVHMPGMTVASFPTLNRGQRCPPPTGMIAGAEHINAKEEAKRSHQQEEECLFFVALSRAKVHLHLYRAEKQPNGNDRRASPFLDWLPIDLVREVTNPSRMPLPVNARRILPIAITRLSDSGTSSSRLQSYEKCPRRFFYTHVLGLLGARKETAFYSTHKCIYEIISWISASQLDGAVGLEIAHAKFEEIWVEKGPTDHAFAADYRALADNLVGALVRLGEGRVLQKSEQLAIDLPNGRIVVRPDEIAELPDGTVVIRKIRTGRKRGDEYDHLDYTLYQLAAESHYGTGFAFEALHLTDEAVEGVSITARKLSNRRAKSNTMLAGISDGHFPPQIDSVTCPRCPHFFICAATPGGDLTIP